ncbi:MAG TPA: DUF1016 family protein [Ignavibacteria bacterium]|nr:DUF1016 family protein [Ignavibacteria bacterium]
MKSFYSFYKSDFEKVQQLVAQIPWGHNIKIISKLGNVEKAIFYLSAVGEVLKTENENPTIGILLCKERDRIEAEYALRGMSQPIGIAEYKLSKALPKEIKSELPTIEEIELATIKAIRNAGDVDK